MSSSFNVKLSTRIKKPKTLHGLECGKPNISENQDSTPVLSLSVGAIGTENLKNLKTAVHLVNCIVN